MRFLLSFSMIYIIVHLNYYEPVFAQQSPRIKTSLDKGWKFHFGHAENPAKDFNYSITRIFAKTGEGHNTAIHPRFNDSTWCNVDLPHDWAVELPFVYADNFDVMAHGYKPVGGLFPETSIGWYRKHFFVDRTSHDQRFVIQFDGIFRDSEIWINGFYLGNNKSGYIGVAYDITDYLNFDRENVLAVRIDATQYEGWFYEGAGIYRHVWLIQYNNIHIPLNGVFIHTNVRDNQAVVNIEMTVENQNLYPSGCSVYSYITDRNGNLVGETGEELFSLDITEKQAIKQSIMIQNPRLWSPDDPYLYRAVSVVKSEGKVMDMVTTRFGIRTISIDSESGLFLNGKHIKVYGVNCHQDHAGVGSALPDYLQYYRVRLLKEMGVNAYRTSHNPPTPELLDACDSLGILVIDETRLLNSSPEYMSQFERLILRDRNHPSIFLWCIGNEEGYVQRTDVGKRIAQSIMARLNQLDPTRTCTYAADLPNIYNGINEVIPVRGFNYREQAIDDYHRDHPDQPTVGTEMGSTVTTRGVYQRDTVMGYVPDQDLTHPWWSSLAEEWWTIAAERDWFMGGFVWTGLDYRGEPTPYRWPNINSHFGIMDMCGFSKNIYYYYQSWWTDKDVLHISPHWNWKGREGDTIDVWVNTNAESVELFLNGKSLGEKEMPRNSHLQWDVVYSPGKLEAIAIKDGRKIKAEVETTGDSYQVVLSSDQKSLIADGKDATVVNVTVQDKQGREVSDANNLIQFSVSGNARIIGVGNGDPSSHEPDKCTEGNWQRYLFNGKCQLIIQSGTSPGPIRIEAASDGLQKGTVEISTSIL